MPRIEFFHSYEDIISIENLLEAWKEFIKGKHKRKDVQEFERRLIFNMISLHEDLAKKIYTHSKYHAFKISDPKPRDIHKASVRDRLLHHAIHRKLSPFFRKVFIYDSHSCQKGKGTHCAIKRFEKFSRIVSKNGTKTVWILKCDIRKFFANIDQTILINIIRGYISDEEIINLLSKIIGSFNSGVIGIGLPLGNLTSQLLVNIYMNEFDQFVKHQLKQKYYIRYADDFVFMHHSRNALVEILSKVNDFLREKLKLSLHPSKVFLKTLSSGVDFLGWVHFPDHRVLRTKTKHRMFKRILATQGKEEVVCSYLGMLKHGNCKKLKHEVIKMTGMI